MNQVWAALFSKVHAWVGSWNNNSQPTQEQAEASSDISLHMLLAIHSSGADDLETKWGVGVAVVNAGCYCTTPGSESCHGYQLPYTLKEIT
jgi:hypothetical protein